MSQIEDSAPRAWPVEGSVTQMRNWLISVRTDRVQMPDNHVAERTVVTHPGAVAILAVDEDDRVLMIRQYRHPVGRELWELPAGLRDADGESPLETARRELAEETGYAARDWNVLVDYYTSPGFSDERIRVYLARGVELAPDNGYQREHEEKFLVTEWVPLAAAARLALAGKLSNGAAVAGVLAARVAWTEGFTGLRPADAPEA